MKLSQVKVFLKELPNSLHMDEEQVMSVLVSLREQKSLAVDNNDQALAKEIWCYEQTLKIQRNFLKAYQEMKDGNYYEAWCLLEDIENGVIFLEKHLDFASVEANNFKLGFIKEHVKKFQSLYPYKVFLSPGILKIEEKCSVCQKAVSLRDYCGHEIGEIYDGEMCYREVTQADLIEVSVVTNPVQKYSVAFTGDRDHYNYSLVEYVARGLQTPFHLWEISWMKKRHPHSRYKHIGRNDLCPCESGKKYKVCCLHKAGVLRPHAVIHFSVPPPTNLPTVMFTDDWFANQN